MSEYRIGTIEKFNELQDKINTMTKEYYISNIIEEMGGGDNVKYLIFDFENPIELNLTINLFDNYNTVNFNLTLIILKNVNLNITFNISNHIIDYEHNFLIKFTNIENYGKLNFIHCKDNDILFDLNIKMLNYGIVDIGDYIAFYPYRDTRNWNIISCYYFYISQDFYNLKILNLKKTNKYIDDDEYIIFSIDDGLFINYKIELETPDIKIFLTGDIFMIDFFYETSGIQNKNDQNYIFLNNTDNETKEKYEEEIKKLKLKNQLLLLLLSESYNQQSKIQNNDLLKLMYKV